MVVSGMKVFMMAIASGVRANRLWIRMGFVGILAIPCSAELRAADDADKSKDYLACMDKAGGVTSEMLDCIGAEMKRQDAQLNGNYKTLMSKVSKKRKGELQEAQRAWIKFRELNCNFYADEGSIAQVAVNDCFLDATTDRAKELKRLIPEN
jgi:uncharacterized protein YecT (DUF1311 family)